MTATCRLSLVEHKELKQLYASFITAADALKEFLNDLQGAWEEAYEGRSERWQASEAAAEAEDRLATVTAWCTELAGLGTDQDIDQLAS